MPKGTWGTAMWENNADTPISFSNLSRTIDLISESKFVYYVDDITYYTMWADVVISGTWPEGQAIVNYINKYVYNSNDKLVKFGIYDETGNPMWEDRVSPYKKTLLIKAGVKFGASYNNVQKNQLNYKNFDLGTSDQVLSIESLLLDSDLEKNKNYYIYLYHYSTYGDQAALKIVAAEDDTDDASWKIGAIDISSPTGTRVISIRKVGGFYTDQNSQIISSSVWDISVRNEDIISESYKVINPIDDTIKDLTAVDIKLDESANSYSSINVDGALIESRSILNSLMSDVYSTNERFGVELRFSPVKKTGNNFEPTLINEVALTISQGYIDVAGNRVKIENDIFLAGNTTIQVSINKGDLIPNVMLGQKKVDGGNNKTIYEGLWRCFINSSGNISFIDNDVERATYIPDLKGWYNTDGERCIGKFRVRYNVNHFYIEKMSVTGTHDSSITPNTMIIYHGTMCPDGLVPCNGRWHDITGNDQNSYAIMPEITPTSAWQSGKWYEDTPNLWDRTVKMVSDRTLPYNTPEFSVDRTNNIVYGSSYDCGVQNSLTTASHSHTYIHQHTAGNLNIISTSGSHQHPQASMFWTWAGASEEQNVVDAGTGGVLTASAPHEHLLSIQPSGEHGHSSSHFAGKTSDPDPTITSNSSSWEPYKEILFCIRK